MSCLALWMGSESPSAWDDFVATGSREGLSKCRQLIESAYECKVESIGPAPDQDKELRVLGRMISYTPEGSRYEPDPRHVEAVLRDRTRGE